MPKRHRVEPGECVSSIAFRHGFFPDTIWLHEANKAVRELRGNPNTLVDGEDELFIPDRETKTVAAATGKVHRFRRRGVPEMLRVRLLDEDGEPRAGISYTFEVGERVVDGTTDDDGFVVQPIPPDAQTAMLVLDDEAYELELGRLPPLATDEGVRVRLANLGYATEEGEDESSALRAAIEMFQSDQELTVTGEADDATRARLREVYRS